MVNPRIDGATLAIRQAIVEVSDYCLPNVGADDDMIDDLALDELELEGLNLIVEELFGVSVPEDLFRTPLYRTPEAFAEWIIRQAEAQSYAERKRA